MFHVEKQKEKKSKKENKFKKETSKITAASVVSGAELVDAAGNVKGGMVAKSGKNKRVSGASVEQKMCTESSPGEKN